MTTIAEHITVDQIIDRAADLIRDRGFWPGGFGNHTIGYSLEGAVYKVLGFHEDNYTLASPDRPDCPRWQATNEAFRAIASDLGEPRPSRAYGRVCDWSEQGNQARALNLLDRVAVLWRMSQRKAAA